MHYIKLQHELMHASWDDVTGKWQLRIRHGDTEIEDTADILFLAVGTLSRWSWPDIPNLRDFRGHVLHTAQWDLTDGDSWEEGVKDWGNRVVGVIGNVRSCDLSRSLLPDADRPIPFRVLLASRLSQRSKQRSSRLLTMRAPRRGSESLSLPPSSSSLLAETQEIPTVCPRRYS